jgi:hypothetical protein
MLMMFGGVMFGDVIAKILHAGVPENANITVADLVDDPEVPHFHGSGALAFHGAVGNSYGGGIVTVNGRGWLRVTHFLKDEAYDFDFLSVEEEGT